RPLAKIFNFGVFLYGGGATRLQHEVFEKARDADGKPLRWTTEYCQSLIDEAHTIHPQLYRVVDGVHRFAMRNGYVVNKLGHRRLTPHAGSSSDKGVRNRALREAWIHLVQALGHDLLQMALEEMRLLIVREKLDWYIVLDTHDGALLDVPIAEAAAAGAVCKHFMESIPVRELGDWLKVPLLAEIKVGQQWGCVD